MKICNYCMEYVKGQKCDIKSDCYLHKLYQENKKLKQECKQLRTYSSNLQNLLSYEKEQSSMNDTREMGSW